jgi:hypothetical protein
MPLLSAKAVTRFAQEKALLVYEEDAPDFLKAPFLQKGAQAMPIGKDYSVLFDLFERHRRIYGLTKAGGHFIAEQLALANHMAPLFSAKHQQDEAGWRHQGSSLKPYRDGEKDHFVWHSWGYKG